VRRGGAGGAGREFGPFAPKRIETWPAARLMMPPGMKNGEMRAARPRAALVLASISGRPPMPEPMLTPTRNFVMRPMPERPSIRPCQVGSLPTPSGEIMPMPVTTTRRFSKRSPQKVLSAES
jgi:hypothetical protein